MGAMQFLPGSHLGGVLPHRHYDDPMERLLEISVPLEDDAFVACPLRRGGCTFHDPQTVHRTATNSTDRPRLAFPLTVQSDPIARATVRDTPWLEEYYAAGGQPQTAYVADGRVVPLPA
jgi:ectoine hydroxylase-related dioxygenase (phytanoyl-CoA dioxygenase family)